MKRSSSPQSPAWQSVLLVCRDCGKRDDAPKKLDPRDMVQQFKRALRAETPPTRAMLSGCLGLCPRRAIAVAHIGGAAGARLVAVTHPRTLKKTVATLTRDTVD